MILVKHMNIYFDVFVSFEEINYHSGKSCGKYSGGCGSEIKTVG